MLAKCWGPLKGWLAVAGGLGLGAGSRLPGFDFSPYFLPSDLGRMRNLLGKGREKCSLWYL